MSPNRYLKPCIQPSTHTTNGTLWLIIEYVEQIQCFKQDPNACARTHTHINERKITWNLELRSYDYTQKDACATMHKGIPIPHKHPKMYQTSKRQVIFLREN